MSKSVRWLITLSVFPGLPLLLFFGFTNKGEALLKRWSWQAMVAISPKISHLELSADGPIHLDTLRDQILIREGDPIFFLPTRATFQRLLKSSEIRDVSLNRDLDLSVTLNVTLRKAVCVVAGRQLRLVDSEGVIFTPSVIPQNLDMPVITGIPDDWQTHSQERRLILLAALELIRDVAPTLAELGQQLAEVHIDTMHGYSLFTDRIGGKIVFGYPPFAPKTSRLTALVRELNPRLMEIEWVNLDYPKKAFVRFKRNGKQIFAYNAPRQHEVNEHG